MIPVSPVIKGFEEVVFAKNQPQYLPLPAIRCQDGTVITRWKLSIRERIKILLTGHFFLHQLTFNQPLQPQRPSVDIPKLKYVDG
jgi:hypothetical protein